MAKVALSLFIIMVIAGLLGFSTDAGGIYSVARISFYASFVLLLISVVLGLAKER